MLYLFVWLSAKNRKTCSNLNNNEKRTLNKVLEWSFKIETTHYSKKARSTITTADKSIPRVILTSLEKQQHDLRNDSHTTNHLSRCFIERATQMIVYEAHFVLFLHVVYIQANNIKIFFSLHLFRRLGLRLSITCQLVRECEQKWLALEIHWCASFNTRQRISSFEKCPARYIHIGRTWLMLCTMAGYYWQFIIVSCCRTGFSHNVSFKWWVLQNKLFAVEARIYMLTYSSKYNVKNL